MTKLVSIETKGVKSEGARLHMYVDRYKRSLVVFNLIEVAHYPSIFHLLLAGSRKAAAGGA